MADGLNAKPSNKELKLTKPVQFGVSQLSSSVRRTTATQATRLTEAAGLCSVVAGEEAMRHEFPESDWKVFSKLRQVALERFCKRVLDEVSRLPLDAERSYHERYLELFRWLGERDDELGKAFDNPRRSQVLWQLAAIYSYGLLEPDEFAKVTSHTRERIQALASATGRRAAEQSDEADEP